MGTRSDPAAGIAALKIPANVNAWPGMKVLSHRYVGLQGTGLLPTYRRTIGCLVHIDGRPHDRP